MSSAFSHRSLSHLAINMFGLAAFAPPMHVMLGHEQFLLMYLTGGVFSNYFSHVVQNVVGARFRSVGASGALYTLLISTALLLPQYKVVRTR